MVNQVRVFEPVCFLCVSVCARVCVCPKFSFSFFVCACEKRTDDDFDDFDKRRKKSAKIQKENKQERFSNLGIFFKKLGALVYVQRIIYTEHIVVQEGLDRNERFS